jgi:hypothetical protein
MILPQYRHMILTVACMSISTNAPKQEWFEKFFRFGLLCKGVVYCISGILASLAAVGFGGGKTSKSEVFKLIYEQPFGLILISTIALGLLGYALFRFFQCFRDIEHKGDNAKGLASRIGFGISGLIYLGLGIYAAKLAITGSSGSGESRQFMVSKILALSGGEWIIGIIGLIIIGNGVYQIYRGVTGDFMKKIELWKSEIRQIVRKAGIAGYVSRGIMLLVVGYLLWHAGMTSNPREAKGTDGAFTFLENKFGSVLMMIIAVGLVGYGIFMFVKARYQRINVE